MTRRRAYAVVAAACALPRLAVLLHERGAVLENLEKSSLLAQQFLKSGTFGYVPGEPSAYTQPLYGWFLIVVYWIAGLHWWSLGGAQILVAIGTALVVYEAGRRFLSQRASLLAAVVATLQPYLVWHDLHGNREILDQLIGAGLFALALVLANRRSLAVTAALGVLSGIAILSNARLTALPLVLAGYLLWRRAGWVAAAAVPILAVVAVSPWVIRNKVEVGCFAITTDGRALWKANNLRTYATLRKGLWIDNVPDIPERRTDPIPFKWYTPEAAGTYYINHGVKIPIDECSQQAHYEHLVFQFWEHHPGAKAKLMVQATGMMWDPRLGAENTDTGTGVVRDLVEPAYVVPLYLLAIAGFFLVAPYVRALAAIFVVYETAAAWVFAGTTRYRVPWDFVLALLAAAALERLWSRLPFRRPTK